jgi:hypothetical protein
MAGKMIKLEGEIHERILLNRLSEKKVISKQI